MKAQLVKALKQIPQTIVTTAKKEIGNQISLVPLKAQIHLEQKLKDSLTASINEYKDIPQQIALEFKKQSTHQTAQPFQISFNNGFYYNQYDYFNDYYNNQKNRYTSTPQPNLAEILYLKESHMRDRLNADMYNSYKR